MQQDSSDAVHLANQNAGEDFQAADAIHAAIRFLKMLRRKKQIVIFALVVCCGLGIFYYFTADKVYQAQAQLLVTEISPDALNNGAATAALGNDSLISTHQRLMESSIVLDGALQRIGKMDPKVRVDLAGVDREKWKAVLRENLAASAVRRTSIIELSYRSKSPEAAQAVLAAVVDSYVEFIDKSHKDVSVEIASILQEELREKETELKSKQEQWVRVSKEVGDLGIRSGGAVVHPLVQRAVKLNDSLISLREKRVKLQASQIAVQSALRSGGDMRQHFVDLEPTIGRELIMTGMGLNPQAAQTVEDINRQLTADRATLETQAKYLGPANPKIQLLQKKIADSEAYLATYKQRQIETLGSQQELGALLGSMIAEALAETVANESQIEIEYKKAEQEAVQLNGRMTELQLVENELQRLRNWHDTLLNQIANIDLRTEGGDVRVAVVGEPVAGSGPVAPRLSVICILSLLAGGCVGVTIAYVSDLLEDRFQSPEELQDQVGVNILAMIQELSGSGESGPENLHMVSSPDSAASEAFRTLRTSLALKGEYKKIAITSSEPGDGKTTVIANLAATYASAGNRTLLIDCDLRKPGLTRLFDMRGLGGTTKLLSDQNAVWKSEVRETEVSNLQLIPAGARPQDPTELFTSSRFGELVAWAEANYDQVLIDCPPVVAATDAAIIGRYVDGLMMVVQPSKNHRKLVVRSVEHLSTLGVQLTGLVLNHVGDKYSDGQFGYGYGYGYGYGSGMGYGVDEEPETISFDDGSDQLRNAA